MGRYTTLPFTLLLICEAAWSRDPSPRERFRELPLRFESARDDRRHSEFVARGAGYQLSVAPNGVMLQAGISLGMQFTGAAHTAEPTKSHPLTSPTHYLNAEGGRLGVETFAQVSYHDVYPGIDVRYRGSRGRLTCSFVVGPKADPASIRVLFSSVDEIATSPQGELILGIGKGHITLARPRAYQQSVGGDAGVPGRYIVTGPGEVAFQLGSYESAATLTIQVTMIFSSYLGGNAEDAITSVALDSTGNVYLAGWTLSTDLHGVSGYPSTPTGSVDAFVAKMDPTGSTLVYVTYLGGRGEDRAFGVAVDASGCAVLTGWTYSTGFPTMHAAQPALSQGRDAFVVKLNSSGNGLVFGTYLGGTGQDTGNAVTLDNAGNVYVAGETTSTNFPVRNPFQSTNRGQQDAFLTKLSPDGTIVYSTYLGGLADERAAGVAVDSAGNSYLTGGTYSTNFPVVNALQKTLAGGQDAFVSKFSATGTTLLYSTYLGGSSGGISSPEAGTSIAIDASGSAYLTGSTPSSNFPLTNAFQVRLAGGGSDGFVAKLAATGSALVYSTYLGGVGADCGTAIAVDASGSAYVAGYTMSPDFPIASAIQNQNAGGYDAFLDVLAPDGAIKFGTYLGGDASDSANAVAVDRAGNIYVAGMSLSYTFPRVSALQVTNPGGYGGFVTKLSLRNCIPVPLTVKSASLAANAEPYNGQYSLLVDEPACSAPYINLDGPRNGSTVSGIVTVWGWAIDNTNSIGTAISSVKISVDGGAPASVNYGNLRTDVCAAFPGRSGCPNVGYSYGLDTASLSPGTHTVTMIAVDSDTPYVATSSTTISIIVAHPPNVQIDVPSNGATVSGVVHVSGWAIDSILSVGTAIADVQVKVDGVVVGPGTYGANRPDVCAAYPGRSGCPNVGFDYALNTATFSPGPHTITVMATNSDAIPGVGSATVAVTVAPPLPSVVIDYPAPGAVVSGTVAVGGWAIDNFATVGTAITSVHVKVDGVLVGTDAYGVNRPDVCGVYPGRMGCPNVGFGYSLNTAILTAGTHTVTVEATDSDGVPNTGSASVLITVVAPLPSVQIDSPAAGSTVSGVVNVSGWAIDNVVTVGTAITSVQVKVDGVTLGPATYGIARPDVCAAYPGRPGCPNVGFGYSLNTATLSPGAHTLTVSAIDSDGSPTTGSASITIVR